MLDAAEMLLTIMFSGVPDCDRFLEGLSSLIESTARATKEKTSSHHYPLRLSVKPPSRKENATFKSICAEHTAVFSR